MEDLKPSQPTKHSRKILWLAICLLIIIAVVLLYFLWYKNSPGYVSKNYYKLGSENVDFTLSPSKVKVGETFNLIAEFKKAYNEREHPFPDKLNIIGQDGKDIMITSEKLVTSEGYDLTGKYDDKTYNAAFNAAAKNLDHYPGIYPEELYSVLLKRQTSPNYFYIQDIGCPIGLGAPTQPPGSYTDTYTLRVHPKTPPGNYTFIIKADAYCNGLPDSDKTLKLTILP